jgi:thymidine phosphorylase
MIDAERVGRAAVLIGAGRARAEDPVDPAVGIVLLERPGARVVRGQPVVELHVGDGTAVEPALALALEAIELSDGPPRIPPLDVASVPEAA